MDIGSASTSCTNVLATIRPPVIRDSSFFRHSDFFTCPLVDSTSTTKDESMNERRQSTIDNPGRPASFPSSHPGSEPNRDSNAHKRFLTPLFLLPTLLLGSFASRAVAGNFAVPYSTTSPTVDGVFSAGEWGSGYNVTFDRRDGGGQRNSTLYFQHDGSSLFVGVDSQWGTGFDVVW